MLCFLKLIELLFKELYNLVQFITFTAQLMLMLMLSCVIHNTIQSAQATKKIFVFLANWIEFLTIVRKAC